jgi:tRNA(fMet)-specific endonuclease VapC
MVAQSESIGLLDTNVVIQFKYLNFSELPAEAFISSITLGELSSGVVLAKNAEISADRQAHVQFAESRFTTLPFDDACARALAQVSADLRAAGRKQTSRAFDSLIAATAISWQLPLFTLNPVDYRGINRIDLRPLRLTLK